MCKYPRFLSSENDDVSFRNAAEESDFFKIWTSESRSRAEICRSHINSPRRVEWNAWISQKTIYLREK